VSPMRRRRPKIITRVYVAGPYTQGDTAVNVANAMSTATLLLDAGYAPFVPHLTHFWHLLTPRAYEDWMTLDFRWLERCDALLRLDGASAGADREVLHAEHLGLPIFYDVAELLTTREELLHDG
jgi:hypothetical protein